MATDDYSFADWHRPNDGGYRCPHCSSLRVEGEAWRKGRDPYLKLVCQSCDASVWES